MYNWFVYWLPNHWPSSPLSLSIYREFLFLRSFVFAFTCQYVRADHNIHIVFWLSVNYIRALNIEKTKTYVCIKRARVDGCLCVCKNTSFCISMATNSQVATKSAKSGTSLPFFYCSFSFIFYLFAYPWMHLDWRERERKKYIFIVLIPTHFMDFLFFSASFCIHGKSLLF